MHDYLRIFLERKTTIFYKDRCVYDLLQGKSKKEPVSIKTETIYIYIVMTSCILNNYTIFNASHVVLSVIFGKKITQNVIIKCLEFFANNSPRLRLT